MALMNRVRCTWSGGGITGPGLSTFYVRTGALGFPADIAALFYTLRLRIPPSVTITVPNSGDVISSDTGALAGVWSDAGGAAIVGSGTGDFALGVGARIRWNTGGIVRGRRVRGSTFVAPLVSSCFTGTGSLNDTVVADFQTAADTLVTSLADDLYVWSRPSGLYAGVASLVDSATVPDAVSWLRSRRIWIAPYTVEYVTVNLVPRDNGLWYATLSVRSTRAVKGMPRTLGSSKPIHIDGLTRSTPQEVASLLLAALRRTSE